MLNKISFSTPHPLAAFPFNKGVEGEVTERALAMGVRSKKKAHTPESMCAQQQGEGMVWKSHDTNMS